MKEVEPQIITDRTFDQNTFKVKHVESRIELSPEQQSLINESWQTFLHEAQKKGSTPWDGTYYRLESLDSVSNQLELSTIKYSAIKGLTHNQDLSLIPLESRPNHISTASLIKTKDNLFVFGVRNSNTMSSYSIDLFGGSLQPDELEVNSTKDIFDTQLKENKEELGISQNEIESMKGIGVILSSKYNVIFVFYTQLSITKEELLAIFRNNNDDEMVDLEFIQEENLESYLSDKGSYRPLTAKLYVRNK